MNQILKKHRGEVKIKINYDNLKKVTSILLNNINDELKKGYKPSQKIALFYMNINNKKYYYSYEFPKDLEDVYNSYNIVDIRKAKRLLKEQMEG